MSEGSAVHGPSKSRKVLGDVTNWLGKRGFSEKEKGRIEENNLNQKDTVKRSRVSSHPCSEVNSLKGNIISSISKVPVKNRELKVPDFSSGSIISKSRIDIESHLSKSSGTDYSSNENAADNPKILGGRVDTKNIGIGGGDAVFRSVRKLDVDSDLVDNICKMDCHGDDAMSRKDKLAIHNSKDPNLTDFEMTTAADSINYKPNTFGKLELWKENLLSGIPKTDHEQNCSNPTHIFGGIVVDAATYGSVNAARENSKLSHKHHDPDTLHLGKVKALLCNNAQDKDELIDDFTAETSRIVSETDGNSLYNVNNFDADEAKEDDECAQSDINGYQNDGGDHNSDIMIMSQSGSIDCTILPESQESRAFGIEGFFETKKSDEHVCLNGGIDTIKTCSCSFCTKAAYIWLDLNYQDIKARVSAMKKSQKEASILAEGISVNKASERHHTESFTGVSKMESDLKHQWRSLFLHMANIWQEEGNQLDASLLPLKGLKEKCKRDLESINSAMPSNNS